jgi:ATP-dependent Clp protease protease subunit
MNENIFINMERALQMGFIGSILAPNTAHRHNNQNFISMSKQKKNEDSVIRRLLARLGFKTIDEVQFKDQIITAADGTEVTVEREEGDPQVGDTAYPDGTYVLDDGTAITVDGNVIATITPAASAEPQEPEPAPDPEPAPEPSADPGTALPTTEELQQEIQQLQITLAGKEAELKELEKTTDELKQQVTDSKAEAENAVRAMEEVRSLVKTEEESTILAKVQSMGGIKWLDTVSGMRSTYNVNNRRFVDHAPAGQQVTESKTQKAKRELEEANEAKRKKRQAS